MKTYLVSYDLHSPSVDYSYFFDELQRFEGYLHCFDSVWFICSKLSAKEIRDKLRGDLDSEDEIIVFPIHKNYATFLAESKNDWLEKNIICDSFF